MNARSIVSLAVLLTAVVASSIAAQRSAPVLSRTQILPGASLDQPGRFGSPGGSFDRRNILLTGYWPPTNEAVRRFCAIPEQNPLGWIGKDWEGRGYDVYSFFPEFTPPNCQQCGKGNGLLEVDYQDTSQDFWALVDAIKPIAIITFSRGFFDRSWEIEMNQFNRQSWFADFLPPLMPTPTPPDASVPAGFLRNSTLPVQDILNAVRAANLGLNVSICFSGDGGGFLSEFIAYHGVWYQSLHSSPADPDWCIAGGHIHVGANVTWAIATRAAEISLRAVIAHVDAVRATKLCHADAGFGGPGAAVLTACGDPLITGGKADLLLRNAPAQSAAVLFAGIAFNPTALLGGMLVPVPAILQLPVTVGRDRQVLLRNVPGGGGPETWWAQFVFLDPQLPQGLGFSNAVKIGILP